jgi:hypothetical protein
MIKGLANMIGLVNPTGLDALSPSSSGRSFLSFRPPRLQVSPCSLDAEIKELCELMTSQEDCENWLILIEKHKDNFVVKATLYHAIRNAEITVHNLFLMLIQCRVLPEDVWVPIEWLCRLKGDRDNELCCLIHFTVVNRGKRYQYMHNP